MKKEIQTYSDNELHALLREEKDREKAFGELYARHSSRIYLYCRRIMGEGPHADDLFQETFLLLLKSAQHEKETTNLPAYLLRIARNLCLNAKRAQKHITVPLEDFHLPVQDTIMEKEELSRLMAMALELLPEEHREAVVLQMYNDLSYNEIAELTNVPMTTVRNRIVRGKKKIREILSPYIERNHL